MMLSTLRIVSRQAARRPAAAAFTNFAVVRAASTWTAVPQGPPVSVPDIYGHAMLLSQLKGHLLFC